MCNVMKKEMKPIGLGVLVEVYAENPYVETMSGEGFDLGNGEFTNPESGEIDQLKKSIVCGKVLEVGAKCSEIVVGDEILFRIETSLPIQFMGASLVLTHEGSVLTRIY